MRELTNPRAPKFNALVSRLFRNDTDALFDQSFDSMLHKVSDVCARGCM
jgi:hypothetical protein